MVDGHMAANMTALCIVEMTHIDIPKSSDMGTDDYRAWRYIACDLDLMGTSEGLIAAIKNLTNWKVVERDNLPGSLGDSHSSRMMSVEIRMWSRMAGQLMTWCTMISLLLRELGRIAVPNLGQAFFRRGRGACYLSGCVSNQLGVDTNGNDTRKREPIWLVAGTLSRILQ